jgi:hypothetical protein
MTNKMAKESSKEKMNNKELSFEKLEELSHNNPPLVLIKKENYALIKILKENPFVKKMLKITNNKKDESEKFIILYVKKKFIGYKGTNDTTFIHGFEEKNYKDILIKYAPKSERKKNMFEIY